MARPHSQPSTSRIRYAADRRALGLAVVHGIGIVATVGAVLADAPWWMFVFGTTPILAASCFVQLISTNNAMHTPVFVHKHANRAWQCVLSSCIGYPVSVFVPVHNLSHHLGLQTPRDILRTTEVRHRSNLLNLLHHMVMGTVHLHLLHIAYLMKMQRSRPRWVAQVRCEIVTVALYLGALALVLGPLMTLAVVYLPAVLGQLLIVGLGYVQHDGCDSDSDFDHSRNFVSPLLNWFILNNGYHTVHHNHAALHWSRARAAHLADVARHNHPALDERSLVRYLWRAFVSPGRRVRYDGRPVQLPPKRARRELWTPVSAITSGASSGAVEG